MNGCAVHFKNERIKSRVLVNQIFVYYLDIPFEETLNRHKQKPNAHEFGEKEMREWWNEKDLLEIIPEVCLNKELSLNEIVDKIYQDITITNI